MKRIAALALTGALLLSAVIVTELRQKRLMPRGGAQPVKKEN